MMILLVKITKFSHALASLIARGGYLSTVHGTGTCHFLGVLFSNHYGIMGIIFTIF